MFTVEFVSEGPEIFSEVLSLFYYYIERLFSEIVEFSLNFLYKVYINYFS